MRVEQEINRLKGLAEKYRTNKNYILNNNLSNTFENIAGLIEEFSKMINSRVKIYSNQLEKEKDKNRKFAIICIIDELELLLGKMDFGQTFKFLEKRNDLLGDYTDE